jgi:hypothetical protein
LFAVKCTASSGDPWGRECRRTKELTKQELKQLDIKELQYKVVIVDKVHWIFQVRADEITPLFTPKV